VVEPLAAMPVPHRGHLGPKGAAPGAARPARMAAPLLASAATASPHEIPSAAYCARRALHPAWVLPVSVRAVAAAVHEEPDAPRALRPRGRR
jgi:hypothetical protein